MMRTKMRNKMSGTTQADLFISISEMSINSCVITLHDIWFCGR